MNGHSTPLGGLKTAYVKAVRCTADLLVQAGIGSRIPSRDRRLSHWMVSLTRVHDSLAIAEMGVPWWTYRAIDIVDAWLAAHSHPLRVFEYGSGASTLWLADRAEEVHSVEHHQEFGEVIGPVIEARPEVHFQVVPPLRSASPAVPSSKEGNAGRDFAEYVNTIEKVGGNFDLVVIDGRAREACLSASLGHLKSDGLVVFDNSWRRRYRDTISATAMIERRLRGLTPTLPYPDQTSLLSFSRSQISMARGEQPGAGWESDRQDLDVSVPRCRESAAGPAAGPQPQLVGSPPRPESR